MQGEIMLISITIILLFNFGKKTSHTSFCFFETSKLVSSQFLLFTLFCFREKNGEKTLQLTSKKFVYMRLPDLQRIARIAMVRCTREAKCEEVQRTICKTLTYVKIEVKKC